MTDRKTNIQVSVETRDYLAKLGKKGDSYDDIIRKRLRITYDWDNVYMVSVPLSTRNGEIYVDMILPKVSSLNVNKDALAGGLIALLEEHDIEILDDDEVPFFNEHF